MAYFETPAEAKVTTEIFVTSKSAFVFFADVILAYVYVCICIIFHGGILHGHTRTVLWRCQRECAASLIYPKYQKKVARACVTL